jgi:hypothetical protein
MGMRGEGEKCLQLLNLQNKNNVQAKVHHQNKALSASLRFVTLSLALFSQVRFLCATMVVPFNEGTTANNAGWCRPVCRVNWALSGMTSRDFV